MIKNYVTYSDLKKEMENKDENKNDSNEEIKEIKEIGEKMANLR